MTLMKHQKALTKLMQSNGFELHRSKNHLVWKHHTGVKIHTASTPSCRHALNQVERDIRRLLSSTAS
jgi:predicted RNA binding protein YcfA (HicA-like mRNA interferase family)